LKNLDFHFRGNDNNVILDPDQLQKVIEQKTRRRQKKKKPKMAVSGKSVLGLRRLIVKKARG
jgi:hypothetical protein